MTIPLTVTVHQVAPEQTLSELDRLVEFNSHLFPFETAEISASLLRRVHEGVHSLRDIATEAHDMIDELQHQLAHALGEDHTHDDEEGSW